MENLFVNRVRLNKDNIDNSKYPFNIKCLSDFDELKIDNSVTLFYGERYNCVVPNYKYLFKVFAEECNKYGILYKMEDIIKAYKKDNQNSEQISFF